MATNIDVVIKACAALLPFSVNVWVNGQRLECGSIQSFKQITTAGPKMAGHLAIELIQQRPDRCVHLIQAKEALVA